MDPPSTTSRQVNDFGDEWDLRATLQVLHDNWKQFLFISILGAGLSLASSFAFKPVYRADAVLIAAQNELAGSGQNIALGGGLGGLASLVGLGNAGPRDNEAIATLKSRILIEDYVREQNLLPILFEHRWDATANRWNTSLLYKIPTPLEAYKLFDKSIRRITEDKKSGLVTISIDWTDPGLAEKWLRDLVQRTNRIMREKAIERSNRNLAYLNDQLSKTTVLELRTAIYGLIEVEIKKEMLANGNEDFAFRYVDPPVVPEKRIFPKRIVFLLLGGLAGFSLAWMFVLFRARTA